MYRYRSRIVAVVSSLVVRVFFALAVIVAAVAADVVAAAIRALHSNTMAGADKVRHITHADLSLYGTSRIAS